MNLEITAASVPRRHDQTFTEVLDGEAVVYEERGRTLHVLSPTATVIWENLDGELSLDGLAAALSDAFGAPLEVVRADTLATVTSFAELGLLDGSTGPEVAEADVDNDTVPSTDDSSPPRFLEQPPHG